MGKFDNWDKLIGAVILLLTVNTSAYAYIDPGTASVVWTVALAPVLGLLAWFGRRFIRLFVRSKPKKAVEDETDKDLASERELSTSD